MLIKIPFTPDMAQASLEGRKFATSRTKRYGKVGDTFYIRDVLFEITGIYRMFLGIIRDEFFMDEGFYYPRDFEAKWISLHPRKGFVPEQKIWFHRYRRLDNVKERS